MSPSDPRVYLLHIRDALANIAAYTHRGREEFFSSRLIQDAVVVKTWRSSAKAVKNLDDTIKLRAPEVPWRRIAGMRDVLIHEYFGVDLEIVWSVVEHELARLAETVARLIDETAPI